MGNPFILNNEDEREEVLAKYKKYICENPELLMQIEELRNKNLVCYCKPLACHGDVLEQILNDTNELMKAFR